jgi:carbamoyl-phosphate synthase large subunit
VTASKGSPPVLLVTGVGDTVGQAIVKAARGATAPLRIVGTDADPLAAGLDWVDIAEVVPHCVDKVGYLASLTDLCRRERVRLLLPGSERELVLLSEHAEHFRREAGTKVLASNPDVLHIALDKWRTCKFLEANGLRHPSFARLDDAEEVERLIDGIGFPLLAKPRRSTGSRGVLVVRSPADLAEAQGAPSPMVIQELLGSPEQEYSVETWTCVDGTLLGPISYLREQLSAGDTYSARIARHAEVEAEGRAVTAALGSFGPCNVQLRMTERGPVTFEINPRFSGGVSLRAHFGFNEVDMAVRQMVHGEPPAEPHLGTGHVRRYWAELYRDEDVVTQPTASRVARQ